MNRLLELLSSTINTFPLLLAVLILLLGIICLMAGKKIYWLATGLNAFMAVYIAVTTVMVWPAWKHLIVAVTAGLLVALLTIIIRKISVSLSGFFIFGLLVSMFITQLLPFESNSFTPVIIFFVVGSLAAFYNLMVPSGAVTYITAFIGGFAVACGVFRLLHRPVNPMYIIIAWVALGIVGSMWQLHQAKKREREMELE